MVKFVFVASFSASWIKNKEAGLLESVCGFQNENIIKVLSFLNRTMWKRCQVRDLLKYIVLLGSW